MVGYGRKKKPGKENPLADFFKNDGIDGRSPGSLRNFEDEIS